MLVSAEGCIIGQVGGFKLPLRGEVSKIPQEHHWMAVSPHPAFKEAPGGYQAA